MPLVRGTRYATLARGAARNAVPTITVPGAQSATSNVALAITGTSISDPESQSQTVSISVSHGTFSLASTTGLSFSVGDGTADASMTFSGSLANCNTAIATLTYTSTTDYYGSDTLTIDSTDSAGGAATQKTVAITVSLTPASLPSLVDGWFSNGLFYTDAGTTLATSSGDAVQQWSSQTGAKKGSQATLGNKPLLRIGANGVKYLEFSSGSLQHLITDITAAYSDFTIVVLYKDRGTATSYERLVDKDFSSGFWIGRNDTAANAWGGGVRETSAPYGIYITQTDGNWNTIVSRRSGTTHKVTDGDSVSTSNTVSGTATNGTALYIGIAYTLAGPGSVNIAQVAVFSDDLSDAQLLGLRTSMLANAPT